MGPVRRVELAFEISEDVRELAIAGILSRDPSLSRAQARLVLLRRMLGDRLFDEAYPPGRSD